MNFMELLQSNGLSEEQLSEITKAMKKNRIFITYEEKLDERYRKMKLQRDNLRSRLEMAEKTLESLKNNLNINEDIQRIRKTFEDKLAAMKNQYEDKIKEMAIDQALLGKLGNAKYPELLLCKFDKSKLAVDSDGNVTGIDGQLSDLKKTYRDMFPAGPGSSGYQDGRRFIRVKNPSSAYFKVIFQTGLPMRNYRKNNNGSSGRKADSTTCQSEV